MSDLSAEDAKLVTLARGARARVSAPQGAAIRDELGRTYSAASVDLPSLSLSAVQLAVAQAVASGATGCECVVLVAADPVVAVLDLETIANLGGADVPVLLCGSDGSVVSSLTAGDVV